MEPPINWSLCQQKGEEHKWLASELGKDSPIYWCFNCGVIVVDFSGDG